MTRTLLLDAALSPEGPPRTIPLTEHLRALGLHDVEACSATGPVLAAEPCHGLLMAAHTAYQLHLPLRLRPDDIWLCIAQGAARHVLNHAEQLRSRIVRHAGRKELNVRRDDFVAGAPDNDWPGVVGEISGMLAEDLGPLHDLFVGDFSTTDDTSRLASRVVLMEAVQKYFVYVVHTLCGIPSIVLEGTEQDWRSVRVRAENLAELGLTWWLDALLPILEGIEATAAGADNVGFWQEIYKLVGGSGGDQVSGWLQWLFPYLGDDLDPADDAPDSGRHAQAFAERRAIAAEGDWDGPKPSDFPSGLSRAPVRWERLGESLSMELVAGFLGAGERGGAVQPMQFWALTRRRGHGRRFGIDADGPGDGVLRLSLRDNRGLPDLQGLDEDLPPYDRCALTLWNVPGLRSLQGLTEVERLVGLSVWRCPDLDDISALVDLSELQWLSVEIGGRRHLCRSREEIAALQATLRSP